MRIAMVTLGENVPSTRFRFRPMVPHLQAAGHDVRVWTSRPSVYDYWPKIGWRASTLIKRMNRWSQLLDALRFRPECIYLERGVYHEPSLTMDKRFRKCAARLVLDVDDGIFLEFPEKIPQLIAMSDHVVTATPTICEYVAQYTSHWTLIPTSVSLERYSLTEPPAVSRTSGPPTIGWIGTAPNVAFLEQCTEALRKLAIERPFQLLVVANHDQQLRKLDLTGVNVRFETWHPDKELEHLRQMDIGIMPLPPDREWMRYKAATKLIQYLAMKIPAIASPIGVNKDILSDQQVGFTASQPREWLEAFRKLLDSEQLRKEMGQRGRQLVTKQFSIEANAPKLLQVLTGNLP